MRILFYRNRLKKDELISWGLHMMEVLNHLSKLGHTIIFADGSQYSIMTPSPYDTILQKTLSKSYWGKTKEFLNTFYFRGEVLLVSSFFKEVKLFFSALKSILHNKPDLIYRRNDIFNSEWILSRIFKIPSVMEVNGIVIDEIKTTLGGDKLSLWTIGAFEKFTFKKAAKYIVVTSHLKEVLRSSYNVPNYKIEVIENGANINHFKPVEELVAKQELYLDINNNYICFVGILYPWQGVEDFISALPYVLKEYPNTRALIVGDGMSKDHLINLSSQLGISDKVIFTGSVTYDKVPCYINASDICVVPKKNNYRSGFSPLKLCEYMACEKPVIATRAWGFEILEESEAGLLVDPEDSSEFARAMIKLLRNPDIRYRMGQNGRKYVLENRSWESTAKKVAETCQNLINSQKK